MFILGQKCVALVLLSLFTKGPFDPFAHFIIIVHGLILK